LKKEMDEMKVGMKVLKMFVVFVLTLCALSLSSTAALAVDVTVSNALDIRVSLAFCYTDASGAEVTQGWWRVAPGGNTTVTLNADAAKPVYYAAFNKDLYADLSTVKNPQVRGWLSYNKFVWQVGSEPVQDGFESRFFKVPESGAVNVDGNWRGR
jgi:uncharacterized membrane protein